MNWLQNLLKNLYNMSEIKEIEYKIGEKIIILQGISNWTDSMNRFVGKIAEIQSVRRNDDYGYVVEINLRGSSTYSWCSGSNHFRHATQEEIEQIMNYTYPELHYLPLDYDGQDHEVLNYNGYTCLLIECVKIKNIYYHKVHDSDLIVKDEHDHCYILKQDAIEARFNNTINLRITHIDNTVTLDDEIFYIKDAVRYGNCSDNIVYTAHGEFHYRSEVVWSSVTEEWYHEDDGLPEPEYDDDDDENQLFEYHSNNTQDYSNGSKFKIGFEIEKSEMPNFSFNKYDILKNTGFVLERDGSVDDGFELISPVLDLYDQSIMSHFEKVREFIDIPHVVNAGGHINVSVRGKTANETLIALNGWLPLIYALYKGRANGSYSKAKKVTDLIYDTDKYQSVRTKNNGVVEFRIVSAVREFKQLEFRINLFKIMFENLGVSFLEVLQLATDPKHKLYKLFTKDIYKDLEKFNNLISTAIKFERDLEGVYTINQIEKATKKLKKPKKLTV